MFIGADMLTRTNAVCVFCVQNYCLSLLIVVKVNIIWSNMPCVFDRDRQLPRSEGYYRQKWATFSLQGEEEGHSKRK